MPTKVWHGYDSSTPRNFSTAGNWVGGVAPIAADDIVIPAGSNSIDNGLDQSATAYGIFRVEVGYQGTIGNKTNTATTWLQLDCDELLNYGQCTAYYDLSHPVGSIPVVVTASAAPSSGNQAIRLKGNDVSSLDVRGGSVGLASEHGESITISEMQVTGSPTSVYLGPSCDLASSELYNGRLESHSNVAQTGISMYGGTMIWEDWDGGTVTVYGGSLYANYWSTSPSLITQEGGLVSFLNGGRSRTLTAYTHKGGTLLWDSTIVTITTRNAPGKAVSIAMSMP